MTATASAQRAEVVLVGATTLLGEEIRRQLAARNFPLLQITMMGEGDEVGQIVDYAGEARLVTELDPDRLSRADLLFLGARGDTARRALDALRRGQGVAIDPVEAEAPGQDPLINMEVNAAALPPRRPLRVRSPHPVVQALSTVLAVMGAGARLQSVTATVLTPASDAGEPGIDELFRQTAGALNFTDKPMALFQRQVAFNAVPHALLHAQQGWPDLDARLHAETSMVLGLAPEQVELRAVLVPVFHGTSMMVSALYDPRPPLAQCRERLARRPLACGPMTPAELEESEAIHVTLLGDDGSGRLGLWVVADNLRGPGALNSVRIAEAVLDAARSRR